MAQRIIAVPVIFLATVLALGARVLYVVAEFIEGDQA